MSPTYLGLAVQRHHVDWALYRPDGVRVEGGRRVEPLADWLPQWLAAYPELTALALGVNAHREAEVAALALEQLAPPNCWIRGCSWNDATLAGALVGQPGLWVTLDWESRDWLLGRPMDRIGGKSLVLTRDANHQTRVAAHTESSLESLTDQAFALTEQLNGLNALRVKKALGPLVESGRLSAARRPEVRRLVEDLADYPGPEPACLALLQKTARRLTELLGAGLARARLGAPTLAAWNDGPLEGPLWNLVLEQCKKDLPELRWILPAFPPEAGLILLLLGEQRELDRLNLDPKRSVKLTPARLARFSVDAWRQLARADVEGWKSNRQKFSKGPS
jgi:hypothetical protein